MINGLLITDLMKFDNDKGDVCHGLRHNDVGFHGFEEIYFSNIKTGAIKAWKMHKKMTLNLIVPVGDVRFNFIELDNHKVIKDRFEITIGESNYRRITVPPLIIFGFKGISKNINVVTNVSSHIHDDNECKDFNENDFIFK